MLIVWKSQLGKYGVYLKIVSKSQLGKYGVYLKIVCVDKTVESSLLAFYTTTKVLFGNPTFIL